MKGVRLVSEIMTTHLHKLRVTDSLEHAEWMFRQHHVRHLPVVKGDKLMGILSLTDLQRLSFADHFRDLNTAEGSVDSAVYEMIGLSQVMMHQVETVTPETTIREVAAILSQREFHALPVVKDEKLVGIITTTDLIKFLLSEL